MDFIWILMKGGWGREREGEEERDTIYRMIREM